VIASSGRPLDAGIDDLTVGLGASARQLRIHDDDAAARAARNLGARAFAFGRHLAFAQGRYRPGTTAGNQLIAHEIAHVEQQAIEGRSALDLSPDVPVTDTYRALHVRIAQAEEDKRKSVGWAGRQLPVLHKMDELAQAVEAKDVPRTKAAVADFLSEARKTGLDAATAVMLGDVPLTLVSRVYLIGLAPESKQLQDLFFGEEGKSYYQQPADRGRFNSDLAIWTRIVEDAIARTSVEDPGHAEVSIDLLLVAFKGVNDAAGKLDPKQVAMDLEYARQEATSGYTPPGYMGAWNVGSYFSYLMALIPQLVVGIERAFQVLLDAAVADLEAGKGSAALAKAKSVLETKLRPAFDFDRLLSLTLPITRSDFDSKTKRHLDYFDERKKAPSAVIHPYRSDENLFFEKDLTIKRIYEIRANQIAVIERLFGFAKDKTNNVTVESAENAAAIKNVPRFKLHDDDSWRAFLLEKFSASRKRLPDDWAALSATVDVLRAYVSAFTMHTPYNIDEFGDNYLGRTFPRALTGQFIEDCGVYALKIAYALSLVRNKLGLIFRAVRLPVHLALVISFKDKDVTKGAFFVNNNMITPVQPSEMEMFARQWQTTSAKGDPLDKPRKLDASRFLGEMAGATFVERTDIPFRVVDVPDVPDVKSPGKRHAVLWKFYHKKLLDEVTSATKKEAQPELKYLALLEDEKQARNDLAVPFWRAAHRLFVARRDSLIRAAADQTSSDAKKRTSADDTLAAHRADLLRLSEPLRNRITQLQAERDEVTAFMAAHPEATSKTARLSPWLRLNVQLSWEIDLFKYLGDDARPGDLRSGKVIPAPWGDPEDLLEPID